MLGTHITKVKSTTIDDWGKEHMEFVTKIGNTKSNEYYLAMVPPGKNKPGEFDSDRNREDWIRNKYERKSWVKRDFDSSNKRNPEKESTNQKKRSTVNSLKQQEMKRSNSVPTTVTIEPTLKKHQKAKSDNFGNLLKGDPTGILIDFEDNNTTNGNINQNGSNSKIDIDDLFENSNFEQKKISNNNENVEPKPSSKDKSIKSLTVEIDPVSFKQSKDDILAIFDKTSPQPQQFPQKHLTPINIPLMNQSMTNQSSPNHQLSSISPLQMHNINLYPYRSSTPPVYLNQHSGNRNIYNANRGMIPQQNFYNQNNNNNNQLHQNVYNSFNI
jgi:hypothetical protein